MSRPGGGWRYLHWPRRHWPEMLPDGVVPPIAPGGAGAFQLTLEAAARVTIAWSTAVEKHQDGTEHRASNNDDPTMRLEGQAYLLGDDVRSVRARLARYAASGSAFLLGLPYEELTIRANSTAYEVFVFGAALGRADWAVPGARALILHRRFGSLEVTVQSKTADSILVDVPNGDPIGNVGRLGAVIMPAVSIYLEAQQGFARYPRARVGSRELEPAERWQLRARLANNGFTVAASIAELSLEAPVTNSGVLDGARLQARLPGADGNAIVVTQTDDALTSGGELIEDVDAKTLHIKYSGDDTTVAEYAALIAGSSLVRLVGTWNGADVLGAADDEFAPLALTGGADETPAPAGLGATLATYLGKPVWDRGIDATAELVDSINSFAGLHDLGGLPFTQQQTEIPDWGRQLRCTRNVDEEWQWAKLFLYTVKGAFRTFWLPTWRQDLIAVAAGAGAITFALSEASGDFAAWYPRLRQHLMIVEDDETITYVRVASAVDNGDGTVTASIVDEANAPVTFDVDSIELVSWLELAHFEKDEVPVTFAGALFALDQLCRVVQQ